MELEKQVCSLELAKKLKALGVNQDSVWYWHDIEHPVNGQHHQALCLFGQYETDPAFETEEAAAFSVAEFGEMLPNGIWYERTAEDNRWRCGHIKYLGSGVSPSQVIWGDTEADARAKMPIYLLENQLIEGERAQSADAT